MKFRQASLIGSLYVSIFGSPAAFATNGYFSHGYGVKSQGIAGIGIAFPQDGLAAATNPAGTALVGNRLDLGLSWFAPRRGAEIQGGGLAGGYDGDNTRNFFIPEVGYTRQISTNAAVGLAIYGNGGMNSDYGTNAFGSPGQGAGVDLSQLFVSPSFAWKLGDKSAIGVAPVFAYQQFAAKGLGAYAGYSVSPGNLSDNGHDSSSGWGVRLGWTGEVARDVTLGLTWASRIKTGKFEKYQGLFADGGSFDIPGSYGAGAAWKATSALTLAADYQRILYGDVNSIANPLSNLFAGNALGSANGPGFGWRNINVVKVGASFD
ncbi:MAG: long-chain fatty acid transporter, partial [Zoogloea sp.]|nr:long-chain fatty acid transporter [Zoogloea sp.]